MKRSEHSERLTWAVCCTVGAGVGLSAVPLILLLPSEYTRPLGWALAVWCVAGTVWLVLDWLLERWERRR